MTAYLALTHKVADVDKYVGGGASTVVPARISQDLRHAMTTVA